MKYIWIFCFTISLLMLSNDVVNAGSLRGRFPGSSCRWVRCPDCIPGNGPTHVPDCCPSCTIPVRDPVDLAFPATFS
ncbi:hypothetical protein MAR_030839 [Mya arenaria]|uniref:Uncharacterized protein n=1 Tax=Mya arenaria TaxID=6604 RepID=A0ABY7F257_MYAAR|nr:hypothetical protein MAR_030839 [Mya arenaria]